LINLEIIEQIKGSIERLDTWVGQNGWAGYDPYDIKGTKLFIYLKRKSTPPFAYLRNLYRILFTLEKYFPLLMRRLFRVQKQINAKGMGLFAKSYLCLFATNNDRRFKQKADQCLEWLTANQVSRYSGSCWGYPFDWQTIVFIPRGTPSSVVSSIAGDAFWSAYKILGDATYLKICESICEFFIKDLNIDEIDENRICFSYTPIDDFHVHNSNLFVAEFLIRVGREVKRDDFFELGRRAANYSLNEQNPDGSICYWGRIQNSYSPDHLDHYHSGFEIRMLDSIWRITGDKRFQESFESYSRFYLHNFFESDNSKFIAKNNPENLYPIDIHACAEAILCLSRLANYNEQARDMLPGVCQWIINNMQTTKGWYRYIIIKRKFREHAVNIPYIRWGQAWMLLALSSFLLFYQNTGDR
jgi:hypothetical protein